MSDTSVTIGPNRSVNATILANPATLPVFSVFNMDTCCRGDLSITDASRHAGIDLAVVLRALREAIQSEALEATQPVEQN